jgi:hypothetical protein
MCGGVAMRLFLLGVACLFLVFLTGCGIGYFSPVVPPMGIFFESTKAPMDINVERTELGSKQGEANSVSILGLFAFGDCSISTAARNGSIKTVNHADYSYLNVLGIYQSYTTIVYGD